MRDRSLTVEEEKELYREIKQFVKDNPGASMTEIAERFPPDRCRRYRSGHAQYLRQHLWAAQLTGYITMTTTTRSGNSARYYPTF